MGLEGVEFVMSVEEAFGLAIPDKDAQTLITPRHLVKYLESRLGPGKGGCLEQRAFHALRRAGMAVLHQPRAAFRPETLWDEVLPVRSRRRTWRLLHHATGVVAWPPMWVWGTVPKPYATVKDTARYLAAHSAANLQRPDTGWSRVQIESVIRRLLHDELGIDNFDWNDRFVQDLGID